jgi:hypothetical protein
MRLFLFVAAVAVVLAGIVPAARADSWMPYGKRRVVDPTGQYYVVVGDAEGGVAFQYVRVKPASEPVTAQTFTGHGEAPKEIGVREGDTVLAAGKLTTAPLEIRVSSLGLGFAAMEEYASVGHGESFVWVGADGRVKHVKRMADLFTPKEIESFTHTTSSIWWFHAAWIDETANEVVVVGNQGLVRVVNVSTGKVRPGGDDEIRRGIASSDPEALVPALDLAVDRKTPGLAERLRAIVADAKLAVAARLRAAVALAAAGDRRGADLVRATAVAPATGGAAEDKKYALANLPRLLGADAIPLLKKAMSPPADSGVWWAAVQGFLAIGEDAVPVLSAMLTEPEKSSDYRGGAAHALGRIGSRAALPALLAAVPDKEEYVANAALNAAIGIGKDTVSKDLAAFLDAKTTQDGRLASYFGEVKEPASVEPLRRALERHPKDSYPRGMILEALDFQAGKVREPVPGHLHGPK